MKERTKPFLKWIGGKRPLLPRLIKGLPAFETYSEPFLGGGALFFALRPEKAFLRDINPHVINAYIAVKEDVEGVIREWSLHMKAHIEEWEGQRGVHPKDTEWPYYLGACRRFAIEKDQTRRAALLIYLMQTVYRSFFQVMADGSFVNTPDKYFSLSQKGLEGKVENLRACSVVLQGAEIVCGSFDEEPIRTKGLYYLDPPYVKSNKTTKGINRAYDYKIKPFIFFPGQRDCAYYCRELDKTNAWFIASNYDTRRVREYYKGFWGEFFESYSHSAGERGTVRKERELIIRNFLVDQGRDQVVLTGEEEIKAE